MVTIEDFAVDVTSTDDGTVSMELRKVSITRVLAELAELLRVSSAADTFNVGDCDVDDSETYVDRVL